MRDFVVVGLCLPIALSRLALTPLIGPAAPYLTSWIAVAIAAWAGGFWPAAVIAAVGFVEGHYILVSQGSPTMGPIGIAIYVGFGLLVAIPGEIYHRMKARRKVDHQVMEEMRTRLARVSRLNAMGELAGTIAHELNQPVTAIASYADAAAWMLKSNPASADEAVELLEKIVGQTRRVRSIVSRVRDQVTGGELDPTPQSLGDLVAEALELVAPASERANVTIRFDFDPAADQVLADRIQVQQVVVNLVRNALEAMSGLPRQELRLASRPTEEGMVEVSVVDNGPGISPEILPNLFQPFATNKADGTGIGLAVCRTIIEGHGGRIEGDAHPDGGAVFRFTLPQADTGGAA